MTEQHYLITVERLCTSREADCVSKWSAVVAESDLNKITLSDAAKLTEIKMTKDGPLTKLRPMTLEEIEAYREEQRQRG